MRARLERPGAVILATSSGMEFPKPDTAISLGGARRAFVREGDRTAPLEPLNAIGGQTILRATLSRVGLATFALELPAQPVELTPEMVQEYFDEIQVDETLREAYRLDPKPWREYYAKFATSFVRVGPADPADRSWAAPVGGPIEIVPEADPTALGTDPRLSVRVLKRGAPLAGLPLAAQANGVRDWTRTDAAGRATFQLRGSGPWMIHGTKLRRVARPDADWESWFATLTIPRQSSP